MFWDSQVTLDLCQTAQHVLGPQGRFLEKPTHFNVSLYTHEAGKFWYGDIDNINDLPALQAIANDAGTVVFVIPESHLPEEGDTTPMHKHALMEIAV